MASGTQRFIGWPIAEAIRRCVDPDLLSHCFKSHRDWVSAGRRSRFIIRSEQIEGYDAIRHNDRERVARSLYHQKKTSYAQLLSSLRSLLRTGKLVAWGRRDSPLASPTSIPESAWNYLRISNVRRSIVVERTKAKPKVFDIRIFPIVEAPDAIERLDGKTFVEAFQICVVDDPQAAVLNKRAVSVGGRRAAFGYDWGSHRAALTVEHGRNSTSRDVIGFLKQADDPVVHNREATAEEAVARRFAKLVDFLATGQLVAEGIPAGGGAIVVIPRSIWRRRQTFVDVLNGDLLELNSQADDYTAALTGPTFTCLMLSKPTALSETLEVREVAPAEVPKPNKSIQAVVTKASAQSACFNWLLGLMRASPQKKTRTRDECWQEAQTKWPEQLGFRGFIRAWSAAVHQSEAPSWSASGRPPKSPQA